MVEVPLQKAPAHTAALSAPDPAVGHRRPTPPLETPGHSWASLGQSLVGLLLPSPGVHKVVCLIGWFWCVCVC